MLSSVNTFTPLWLLWGVIFAGIEGTAIWAEYRSKSRLQGGTLSALVRRATSWKGHPVWRSVIMAGWAVLTAHFFFGFL